jgi:serine/threonine protein kinase
MLSLEAVMLQRDNWEEIERLGGGGQSDVFLVRRPERRSERRENLRDIRNALDADKRATLATAIYSYARPDTPSELGALKVFKVEGPDKEQALKRLENEISSLASGIRGLPRLLDSNVTEAWLVTEFFPEGTLERHPDKYKGRPVEALTAFRSLVETVTLLHSNGYVHRDIKPANVFIRKHDELVLGDFGIAFVPGEAERLTDKNERVGPRDYMPQWADLGERLEGVHRNFDVYMLGKLLWCMVSGRQKLPREYQKRLNFNLAEMYPTNPGMHIINFILDHCVVEDSEKCLHTAEGLLRMVDHLLGILNRGGQLLSEDVPRPCRVCGEGFYTPDKNRYIGQTLYDQDTRSVGAFYAEYFVCSRCGHVELFDALSTKGRAVVSAKRG